MIGPARPSVWHAAASCLALLAVLLPAAWAGATARLVVQPSGTRVMLGEAIQVTVSVESNEPGSPELVPPSGPDFRIEQGSTSRHIEINFNGAAQRSLQFTYVVRPARGGAVVIPSFVYQNPAGSTVRSEPFTLQVLEPPPPPRGVEEISASEPLTVLLQLEPTRVYMGQETLLSVTRYARVNMEECRAAVPEIQKAWFEELLDSPPPARIVALQGTQYETGLLRHVALFPLEPGALEIPAIEVQCRSAGRGFFGGGSNVLTRRSAGVALQVLPLPDQGRPASFTGAVGRFSFEASLERPQTRVGEPMTLQLLVTGLGNFRGFNLAPPTLPPELTSYAPTTTDQVGYDAQGRLQGKKKLEQIVAPKQAGRITIPPISFAFFDPDSASYRELQSPPLTIDVAPAEAAGVAGGRTAAPPGATAGGELPLPELPDLRPLRPGGHPLLPGARAPQPLLGYPLFWLALALPPLALAGFELRERAQRSRKKNEGLARFRRARRTAERRLEQAAIAAAAAPGRGALSTLWGEAATALHGYLKDRLGEPTLGLTRDLLRATLIDEQGYPAAVVDELIAFLDEADLARFAGGLADVGAAQLAGRARQVLDQLDRHAPRRPAAAARELAP